MSEYKTPTLVRCLECDFKKEGQFLVVFEDSFPIKVVGYRQGYDGSGKHTITQVAEDCYLCTNHYEEIIKSKKAN